MQYDREITITVGNNRKSVNWQPQSIMLSEFYEKLRIPNRSTETMQEYLNLKKSEQDDKKDIGGFVAGTLSGPRRRAGAVTGRDIITLDFDTIPPGGTDEILKRVDGLGCGYCIYSTRKHSPASPRLRILVPFDRTVTADEYEPSARFVASLIGIEFADPTTFEATRLMYWPSCCYDSDYVFTFSDKPLLDADGLLHMIDERLGDWRDVSKWPQVPGADNAYKKLAMKQSDPLSKAGVVGAFCRTYDIYGAMDTYLDGIYEPVDNSRGRFTYLGGTTTGGAVVYDNGMFLYSHHSTDPCCGRLVNAFDLVRMHKFGEMDDGADPNTPTNRLPSYAAMCNLAIEDPKVSRQLAKERADSAVSDFQGLNEAPTAEAENFDWTMDLELNKQTGTIKATIDNIWLILENDPLLKGKFALNQFAGRGEVLGALPWDDRTERRLWDDNDNQGLYWYMERYHHITGNGKIDGALSLHSTAHAFNEIQDYLRALKWDGMPRLDTLFIDYLGAQDTPYTRAVTRKAFTAAVTRAMVPGAKYDNMLILAGPQGIGKSTLLDKMSRGWFNDSIRTFEGKEASELLQGVWLVEIAELDAFRRTDVARIKQFLSLRTDRFRAAYGRHVKELPRCCVFFGTSNTTDFLQDRTGNRRFWPVDAGVAPVTKSVWFDLPGEIDQLWAEAVVRWQSGESLFLKGDLEAAAKEKQEEHREVSAREGIVLDFLSKQVPEDWAKWPLDRRRMFWGGAVQGSINLVDRDRVCALEVWCEALDGKQREIRYSDTAEINGIIEACSDWEKTPNSLQFGYCGKQRGFTKKRVGH